MADPKKRWKEKSARFVATLVYVDEPQVILLDHGDDAKIIAVAIERDGMEHPFLGAEINHTQWIRYQRQFVDLRYLFDWPRWKKWYLFDLASIDEDRTIPLVPADKADYRNESFLPAHGFFSRDHTEPDDIQTATNLATQKYKIDGTWEPIDLSLFFARIYDLYSFFLGMKKFTAPNTSQDQKKAFIDAVTYHPLRGGSSYVNLYSDLRGLLGFDERLAMRKIVKQSPGFVDIEGKADTLADVGSAYENFADNYEELKIKYTAFHKYLSNMGLLKDPDRFEPKGPVAEQIKKYSQEYAVLLDLDYTTVHRIAGRDGLLTAKILLAHWRRLDRYFQFFAEGRVRLSAEAVPLASSPSIDTTPGA